MNFTDLTEIPKEDFLMTRLSRECSRSDRNDRPLDKKAVCTLVEHLKHQGQRYYRATLTEEGFKKLVIAHHKHGPWLMVSDGGQPLREIAEKYLTEHHDHTNECWLKVERLRTVISEEWEKSQNIFPEEMMPFVSDVGDLAIQGEGHYKEEKHGPQSLYIGGYHRFAAYDRWVMENGFHPLRLYYCEVTGTAR